MDQALEQTLALTASRDDLLGVLIVDPLISQRTRHVVSDETNMRLQVQRRRYKTQRAGFADVVSGMVVDVFGNQPEARVQRMQRVERVRLALCLFLHPLDQQLEHFHRQATIANTTQTQTKRFRRDALTTPDREVVRGVGNAAGRVANGRIEDVQPFGTVVSASHIGTLGMCRFHAVAAEAH
ncbi:hypothetical protein DEE50_39840 [Burkholderia cepacia]|uniref:Uncharacterized protein n=1 Tax=Burkholderia cepacia TaxID=292 RepID=A0A8I1DMS5_BURCE|nr:hypothetical protein [Burkholderia cepacia]MBH9700449.1 hypothetical protein [Burkholderia cepacia]MBH9715032.1 hypothetical protein [Burkholderia cepacia]MBH9735520.1 hypothetical protein [Burkholderia cepacia]MBX3764900.1 hypothetical protein [Burkholderia cepacia]